MHQSNHTPEQRGVDVKDIFYRDKIYKDCSGQQPLLPSFGDRLIDVISVDNWNKFISTCSDKYPLIGPHSFKDGEDVTGRYELGYQISHSRYPISYEPCDKSIWEASPTSPRRIVAIAIELDEEEHNIVFEGSNRYCSCGHPECTRYQPLPSKGQEGEAERKAFTIQDVIQAYTDGYSNGNIDTGLSGHEYVLNKYGTTPTL
jgi:hypothetical protein